jgi:transposase-like protein
MKTRKRYSPKLKSELALAVLKEENSLSELASEHGIHPNQLRDWRKTLVEGAPTLFERGQQSQRAEVAAYEQKIEELYTEIGRLSTRLNWLQKKSSLSDEPR